MAETQGLSARQLLEGVYSLFKEKLNGREIKLPSRALSLIADDSDWHRTRVGYTGYDTAVLLRVGAKEWAVAFGTKCGSYPADPYNCDIAAVPISLNEKSDEEIAKEIHEALERSSYFYNSLIYAMADGRLAVRNNRFGQKVLELLKPKVQEFIAQDLEIDPRYFTMDLRPLVKSSVQYKPEFVAFLFEMLCAVLAA